MSVALMIRLRFVLIAAVLTPVVACFAQPAMFEDSSSLLSFEHRSLQFGGDGLGGAAWLDYNNDGLLDLFLTNGKTQSNALFENDGLGGFTRIASAAGAANGLGNCGVLAADFDNDGFTDLFLTGEGGIGSNSASACKLYRNDGAGAYVDVGSASGIVGPPTAITAAAADVNNDGLLDLFIAAPGSLATRTQHASRLYLNQGNFTFLDISAASGVDDDLGACAAIFTDYNRDGWIDLLVANCNDVFITPTPIQLFVNDRNNHFTEIPVGLNPGGFWMGLALGDIENDGDLDIFSTNLGNSVSGGFLHALYRRNANGSYTNVAAAAGVADRRFGWGCSLNDYDNDGFVDLFFSGALPGATPPNGGNRGTLMFNDRDGTFTNQSATMPVNLRSRFSSGVASGDYDNDGFVDIVVLTEEVSRDGGNPVLLHNLGNDNGSLQIRLVGVTSNRDAIGARIVVASASTTQLRELAAGSSFASTESPWPTFGLASDPRTTRIVVTWPSGLVERFPNADAGSIMTLVEGSGLPPCVGDLNDDNEVGLVDLGIMLANFGTPTGAAPEDGDVDGDGDVDLTDLGQLLAAFGTVCS